MYDNLTISLVLDIKGCFHFSATVSNVIMRHPFVAKVKEENMEDQSRILEMNA